MSISSLKFTTLTSIGRDEQKKLTQILNNLIDLPQSTQFLNPVPWKEMQLDDYPSVVKYPMNLYKVQQKMKNRQYNNAEQALDHIQLIWDNCKAYNKEGFYFQVAEKMEKAFRKMIRNYLPAVQLIAQQISHALPAPQIAKKPLQKNQQGAFRQQPQTKMMNKGHQQKNQTYLYEQECKSEKEMSQEQPQMEEIPLSEKIRFQQRLKQITQQQLAQIVILIQQNCPQGFKHISGGRYQIVMENIDIESFKKLSQKVDQFIQSQKITTVGNKKVQYPPASIKLRQK